jgi:hypothetical protein
MDCFGLHAANAVDSGSRTRASSSQQGFGGWLFAVPDGPQRYAYAKFK